MVVHTEPQAISQFQSRLSHPALVSAAVTGRVSCDSLYLPVSLSDLGDRSLLWPHLSHGSKKGYWFYTLPNFLLVRTEWWPSKLDRNLEVSHVLLSLHFLWIFFLYVFTFPSSIIFKALPMGLYALVSFLVQSPFLKLVSPWFIILSCYLSTLFKSFSSPLGLFLSL